MHEFMPSLLAGLLIGMPFGPLALSCVRMKNDGCHRLALAVISGGALGDTIVAAAILGIAQLMPFGTAIRMLDGHIIQGVLLFGSGCVLLWLAAKPQSVTENYAGIVVAFTGTLMLNVAEIGNWGSIGLVLWFLSLTSGGAAGLVAFCIGTFAMWYGVIHALSRFSDERSKLIIHRVTFGMCALLIIAGSALLSAALITLILPAR